MKWGAIVAAAGVGLIVFSQFALGALLIVGGIGLIALESMKKAQANRPDAIEDDVNPADRHLLAPIRKQLAKIEEITSQNAGHAGIKVIGGEALNEGQSIYRQCVTLVIEKANARKSNVQIAQILKDKSIAALKLTEATSDEEKDLYQTALNSYDQQAQLLAERNKRFEAIDAQLAQAEAALKLIVTQLSTMARQGVFEDGSSEELRESLSRLQALGQSLGETGDFLENINK